MMIFQKITIQRSTKSIINRFCRLNSRSISTSPSSSSSSSTTTSSGDNVRRTPLYQSHLERNGKMVNFENFLLPVQYQDQSINQSHLHTRKYASIFDVSHMLQSIVYGRDAIECLESICTADIRALPSNSGTLTVFTNENGGILDDLIVTKMNDRQLYIVSNAGRIDHDKSLMNQTVATFQQNGKDVQVEYLDCEQRALLALQGPQSMAALQKLCPAIDLSKLYFMQSIPNTIIGSARNCRITRCGYTGEDGFELSMAAESAPEILEQLLALTDPWWNNGKTDGTDCSGVNLTNKYINIKLAGLGARDTLRLEAGLCLYGSDLDETITPIEAGLQWLIAKRRRIESVANPFPGSNIILNQIKNGCQRYRIGFRMATVGGQPPARHGCEMLTGDGEHHHLGTVTSGCPSPCLTMATAAAAAGNGSLDAGASQPQQPTPTPLVNIGMGYINDGNYKMINKTIKLKIRDKIYDGFITKMPFIPAKYYSSSKNVQKK